MSGVEKFDQIITIEQSAITKMKRSYVATYSELYTQIRKIFGGLKAAKDKGLTAMHFSFNTKGGRCENCEGLGYVTSNMLFFANLEVTCPVCGGSQFNDEVLSVKYQGHSVKDILQMSVEDALFYLHLASQNRQDPKATARCRLGLPGTWTNPDNLVRRRRATIEVGQGTDQQ